MPNTLTPPHQVTADLLAAALSAGRYDLLVEDCTFPMTVFIEGRSRVFATERELWAFYQGIHSSLRAAGFQRVTARVTAEDLPRGGRYRVWTDWIGQGPGKIATTVAATICYCSHKTHLPVTEMVEFTRLVFAV
jgi:hypothetical protein